MIKKSFFLFALFLFSYNIVYAQPFLDKGKKDIMFYLEKSIEYCTRIAESETPEQIYRSKTQIDLHEKFVGIPLTYDRACWVRANVITNHLLMILGCLEEAMIIAAKDKKESLTRKIQYENDFARRIIDDAKAARLVTGTEHYDKKITEALNSTEKISINIKELIDIVKKTY